MKKTAILVLFSNLLLVFSSTYYDIESYPNPVTQPAQCKMKEPSWICNPSEVVSNKTAHEIQSILSAFKEIPTTCPKGSYQMAVVLMERFKLVDDNEPDNQAKELAKGLHNKWGVGQEGCNNGIVFLLSRLDRQVYISTGSGAQSKLTDSKALKVIELMKPDLRDSNFDKAVTDAITLIKAILEDKVENIEEAKSENGLMSFLVVFGIGAFIVALSKCCSGGGRYHECKKKLDLIQRQEKAKKFNPVICPICLEDFDPKRKKEILDCGHTFCLECIDTWHKKHESCPICRDKPTTGNSKDTYRETLPYYLTSVHTRYPEYVPQNLVHEWTSPNYSGNFIHHHVFVSNDPVRSEGSSGSSGSDWGGGFSGGGAGSSW